MKKLKVKITSHVVVVIVSLSLDPLFSRDPLKKRYVSNHSAAHSQTAIEHASECNLFIMIDRGLTRLPGPSLTRTAPPVTYIEKNRCVLERNTDSTVF